MVRNRDLWHPNVPRADRQRIGQVGMSIRIVMRVDRAGLLECQGSGLRIEVRVKPDCDIQIAKLQHLGCIRPDLRRIWRHSEGNFAIVVGIIFPLLLDCIPKNLLIHLKNQLLPFRSQCGNLFSGIILDDTAGNSRIG